MRLTLISILSALFLSPTLLMADGDTGNRYNLDREYHSDISASTAYVETLAQGRDRHDTSSRRGHDAVIVDVRTIEEYVGGHPPRAYSIPFPHVYNRQHDPARGAYIPQDPDDFVAAVDALGLPKDTLIITMCRTGFRSVLAGNLLAGAGYTNVRNMWEGFVGRLKTNTEGDLLDLDGDGSVDDDPYGDDRDGWSNFAGLPVSKKLKHRLLYAPYMHMYYSVEGER
ncbi:MAG: hypothetical protein GWO05_20865 [Gammaproteobacteria bacterium]|nr:hypothetical protein [Gammaproteobacteria bacterium]